MRLQNNNEIVGVLSKIKDKDSCIELVFMIQKKIEIPQDTLSWEKLQSVVGKRIGIFNCGGYYKLRKI